MTHTPGESGESHFSEEVISLMVFIDENGEDAMSEEQKAAWARFTATDEGMEFLEDKRFFEKVVMPFANHPAIYENEINPDDLPPMPQHVFETLEATRKKLWPLVDSDSSNA